MIAKSTESRERVKGQSPLCLLVIRSATRAFRPRRGCTPRNRESAQSGRGIPRRTGRGRTARLPHPLADGSPAQAASPYDGRSANPAGLAPGIIMAQGDKAIVMLPGPPKEMKAVLSECCHLFINRLSDQVFVSINIKCKGPDELPLKEIGEAPEADILGDILDNENHTLATYAKEHGVLIRVTASGKTREEALTAMQPVVTKIAEILAGKIAWVKEEV